MDPNAALRRLTELAESIVQGDPESSEWEALQATANEHAETFLGLDEWLRKGGFLPESWAPNQPVAVLPPRPTEPRYACPVCGSLDVELCFPAWVEANDLDNRELWQLDVEASPEKDSDKGYCPACQANVLVRLLPLKTDVQVATTPPTIFRQVADGCIRTTRAFIEERVTGVNATPADNALLASTCRSIHALLDEAPWSVDVLRLVAKLLRAAGLPSREVHEETP